MRASRYTEQFRADAMKKLRSPGSNSDRLLVAVLDRAVEGRCYTTCVEDAMTLVPRGVHFLLGRFENSEWYWCDIGVRPQVQGWGRTPAAAVASAAFGYLTHPGVRAYGPNPDRRRFAS